MPATAGRNSPGGHGPPYRLLRDDGARQQPDGSCRLLLSQERYRRDWNARQPAQTIHIVVGTHFVVLFW